MKTLFYALIALVTIFVGSAPAAPQPPQDEKTLWQPYYIWPRSEQQHLSLDGDWELGYRDTPVERLDQLSQLQRWIHARVPTSVQWALYAAGELPHPYYHLNSKKYTWVPDKVWYFRRTFQLPSSKKSDYALLCFDGTGYYTRIWLNGTLLGRHEGLFGGPEIEVGQLLREGSANDLVVEVKAGSYGVHDWNPESTRTVILPWGIAGGNQYVTTASGIGPREFQPFGIWRSVRLEMLPRIHLDRPFLVSKEVSNQFAQLELRLEVLANTRPLGFQLHPWTNAMFTGFRNPLESQRVDKPLSLRVQLLDKTSSRLSFEQTFPLELQVGRNWVKEELRIPAPKLWWPNGIGKPNLYRAKLSLLSEGMAIDEVQFDYGIRTLRNQPSAGPRTQDRWADWQFVVNGRPFFVKGVNWAWPFDVLLHLPRERYRWVLEAARAAGIQMIRVWGGGNPETEEFFSLCDEMGILVWEDFPIGNQETPAYPQDVWEAQVLQIIFSDRNHPSLAVWCGGNEFNPYSFGNATTIGILERSVADFDGTRFFTRTTPDPGDIHPYVNFDPTWYGRLYRDVPFVSETGIYNMPEPASLREVIDPKEFESPLRDIFSKAYAAAHPEFIHHLLEYQGQEPRTLWSRATQMDDLSAPNLETFCEASQMAAGEFTQIISDLLQANYPVTTGLMPWSLTVPWPIGFFMLIDGLDQPTASYYFLKRTYEPTHVLVKLPELVWGKDEKIPITLSVLHTFPAPLGGLKVSAEIFGGKFEPLWRQERPLIAKAGPSVNNVELGEFAIPDSLQHKFFFVVAELKPANGKLLSRSVYWPRCLKAMEDPEFRKRYRASPQPSLIFEHGPWLKRQVTSVAPSTSLKLGLLSSRDIESNRSHLKVRLLNTGRAPAFLAQIDIQGTRRAFYATDEYFWLSPGEERDLEVEVLWRDPATRAAAKVSAWAWNAEAQAVSLPLPTASGTGR
jgi:beta-mannosidase